MKQKIGKAVGVGAEEERKRHAANQRVARCRQRKRERGDVDLALTTSFTEKELLKRASKALKYESITEFVMDCCKPEAEKAGITLEAIANEVKGRRTP